MPPMGFGAALSGVSGLFGLVNGIGQLLKSKRMNPVRPEYQIPEETRQQLALQQNLLNAEMPGEQQQRQDIYTNQANTLGSLARGASDQSQYLAGLGAVQGQTNSAFNNLGVQRAQNYYNNLSGLERAQQNMAAARDKAFELNQLDPYLMQMQQKYQLQNAGNQNIASGLGNLSMIGASLMGQNNTQPSPTAITQSLPNIPAYYTPPQLPAQAPGGVAPMGSTGYNIGGLLGILPEFMASFGGAL